MPTVNEELQDATISHAVSVQRFAAGTVNKSVALLTRGEADILRLLNKRLERIIERGFDSGPATTARLEKLLKEVRALNTSAYKAISKELRGELSGLAAVEADWHHGILATTAPIAVSAVAPSVVQAAVLARPFQGRLLKEWLSGLEAGAAARVRDAIRQGFVQGETLAQIRQRIRGTRALGFKDGIAEINRRNLATMVRTAVNHTSNYAREVVYKENADLMRGVEWNSSLDGRTCTVCASLDSQVFPLDKGPRPPAHLGCRCQAIAVLKSAHSLGLPPSTRASMDGQVPDTMNYEQWLKTKPAAFQDQVLGKTKGALFRRGGVSIDRFVDRRNNELNLDELRAEIPAAFKRANVD